MTVSQPDETTQRAEKLTCGQQEAAQMLGIGRASVHRLLESGRLKSVRLGRKYLIPLTAIDEFLKGSEASK